MDPMPSRLIPVRRRTPAHYPALPTKRLERAEETSAQSRPEGLASRPRTLHVETVGDSLRRFQYPVVQIDPSHAFLR